MSIDTIRMSWFLVIGMALSGWTLLLILSSERQRRLIELEAKRHQALAALKLQQERNAEIPMIG